MSRTYRILLVAVVAVLAVGGYWKMVLTPKRAEAADLAKQVATQQAELAQTQALLTTYKGAQGAYKANYAAVVRLGKAVPGDDDTRSLVVQLDATAKRSGVAFENIDVTSGTGTGSTTTAAASAVPGAVSAGSFSAMPFSFSFSGDFATLGNFFSRLERFVTVNGDHIAVNGRLVRVDSITLEPGETGWPGLHATVGASSYIVPPATPAATKTPAPATSGTTATAADNAGDLR